MAGRALSFGSVAQAYERYRPGYPAELVDLVTAYAGRPVRTALEIGAGTGKATRLFAGAGIAVTATDPDPAMLAELHKHLPGVRTVRAAFEDLTFEDLTAGELAFGELASGELASGELAAGELAVGERFGLVYAAAALHWTQPEGRWERIAGLLSPGGVMASFGGPVRLADPAVEEAVRVARSAFLDTDEIPSPDGTPPEREMQWPGTELLRSPLFEDVRQVVIPRRSTMGAREYVGHLSTISAYLELPAADRDEVYRRILEALPDTVEIIGDVIGHLARRR